MSFGKALGDINSEPNVVPMCDIMLVLLIIFMVITPLLQSGTSVDLVKAMNAHDMKDADKRICVFDYCIEINRLENAGDRALEEAMGRLFEGRPDPLETIKWKDIYEGIEHAIDKCEDVANTIETILVKQA